MSAGDGAGRLVGHFADRLATLVEARESQVVLGLDPEPAALWPGSLPSGSPPDPDDREEVRHAVAAAVARHCGMVIEAVAPLCVAAKLQLACFERLGPPGWSALEATARAAREHGLLVIADAKRGDVASSAHAYAQALLGRTPTPLGTVVGLGADAVTVNPLLGRDALEPFAAAVREEQAGLFALVRTSNPGAAEIQDAPAPRAPLHERLAVLVAELGEAAVGECGLSGIGAVAGATHPQALTRLRELMPRAVFLLPGVGAQGGRVEALAPAFAPHPAAGLIAASRSIVDAGPASGQDPALAARASAEELRRTGFDLARSSPGRR